jgi:hypothetical protein
MEPQRYPPEAGETLTWVIAHGVDRDDPGPEPTTRARPCLSRRAGRSRRQGPELAAEFVGELYLAGEVDAELRRPVPEARPPDKVRPGWWAEYI